ncbi:hypothetical protein, conserved [Eimeria praecox]|uniref:Uncharacterized protein n=1 Tax=Eimeria praecox TaxID=51316 RepID=U6GJ10_9EIME|nr:hypothetical protein, conserved [Eimeria praecox]
MASVSNRLAGRSVAVNQSISENVSSELPVFVNPQPNLGRHDGIILVRDPYNNTHCRASAQLKFSVEFKCVALQQIFSKLTCGKWPTPDAIAQRINRALQQPSSFVDDGPLAPLKVIGPVSEQASPSPPAKDALSSHASMQGAGGSAKRMQNSEENRAKAEASNQLSSEQQSAEGVPESGEAELTNHAVLEGSGTHDGDHHKDPSTKKHKETKGKRHADEDKKTENDSGKANGSTTAVSDPANTSTPGGKPKKRHKDKEEGSKSEEPSGASLKAENSQGSEQPSSTLPADKAKKHHKSKHSKDKEEGSQEAGESTDNHAAETDAAADGDSGETGEKKKKKSKSKAKEEHTNEDGGAVTKADSKKKKKKAADEGVEAEGHSAEDSTNCIKEESKKKKKAKDEDKESSGSHDSNKAALEKLEDNNKENAKAKEAPETLEGTGADSGNTEEKRKKAKKGDAEDDASPHEGNGDSATTDAKKKKKKSDGKKETGEAPEGHDEASGVPDTKKKKKKSDDKKEAEETTEGHGDASGDGKKKKKKDKGEEHEAAGENKDGADDSKGDKPKKKSKKEKKDSPNDGVNETGDKHKSKGNPLANCSNHPACAVTRNYELTFPVGAKQTQKLSYQNPKEEGLNITIVSSDENVMTPKKSEMTLAPGESVKVPVAFQEVAEPCEKTVYLYMLQKESEQIMECVEISLTFK